jgi:hypothetical protein
LNAAPAPDAPTRVSDRKVLLVLAAISALGLIIAAWSTRGIAPLRPDTGSYFSLDPARSVGYPAFLELVRFATGHVRLAVQLQEALLAGSLFALGWSFHHFARRPVWSAVFQVLLFASLEMWRNSAVLITEAVATACVALWCALLLRMMRRWSLTGFAGLAALSAFATMVRPSLIALFIATAVFGLVTARGRTRAAALLMVPVGALLALGATPAADYFVNGSATTTSPFARGILQHSLFCSPGRAPVDADSAFVENSAAPIRRYIETAPPDIQPILKRVYSARLRFGLIIPVIGRRHHLDAGWQTDPIVSRIAFERLDANPLCYARSVAQAYLRMMTYETSRTPGEVRQIRRFVAAHPMIAVPIQPFLPDDQSETLRAAAELHVPAPSDADRALPRKLGEKSPLLLLVPARLLYTGAAVLGLLSILALGLKRRVSRVPRKTLAAMAAMGIGLHGVLIITAIVELGVTRYTIPLWPIVCTSVAMAAILLGRAPNPLHRLPRAPLRSA